MSDAPTLVRISAPLFLVSEIQRSGGSMMAQLFDGHPQIYAHPFEIQIGYPKKWHWPRLDLEASPESWFERLFETPLRRFVAKGYAKGLANPHALADRRPFHFGIDRQREIFVSLAGDRPRSQREVLDWYFTSFFAAWADWEPTGRERCVAGFTPALIALPESVDGFFSDYPDGRMISIVRDPRSWWVSARNHNDAYRDRDNALTLWERSTRATLIQSSRRPERTLPLTYERLVRSPEDTMRQVAAFLGLDYDPILTVPTFLGKPVRPNSSFAVDQVGIGTHGLDRSADLDPADRATIEARWIPLYAEAEARVVERLPAI